ncbi:hydroxymethylglutaryl-CoA reductase, degradative [Lactobacillus delbrueckii]|uniref:hydroxymethylglutaryl-CoA reductase, degradative n=1 Tax=Lactobacillus delbrueckii TaxID=1584 RepID=UPI0006834612|nr:hydroxymethylglutaryl-CoA reductase, degradative [Lactobacillus delbrueckii]APP03239.1 hydroxymethylglutaryl-CoA reductase, degradative [Lactobacillus delbrueckii subsp. indicus]KNE30741.1 hydroxymethylglutaryl-CoA reductase [Lactobacillus delbrueckii subsp. indicus]
MKFYQLPPEERRQSLQEDGVALEDIPAADLARLDEMSENVVGEVKFPLSCLTSALVNGKNWRIPMTTEEASVVAAANHGMSVFAKAGGVKATSQRDGIYGQIVLEVTEAFSLADFKKKFPAYIKEANMEFASLIRHGGGLKDLTARQEADLVYLLALVDPAEAMGANKTNAILEFLAQKMLAFHGVEAKLFAILSNYPSQLTTAKVAIPVSLLSKKEDLAEGREAAKKMALLAKIGSSDPYRAVTNNKGIMNGVDAVMLATGNDYRAVEAACHAYAAKSGQYRSLSSWKLEGENLLGQVTLPLALGVVGGSISSRPDIRQSYAILGKIKAAELAELTASVALANNFAALNAISTKGIQAGHMRLQSRNVVQTLPAAAEEKEAVYQMMISQGKYGETAAKNFLKELRGQ